MNNWEQNAQSWYAPLERAPEPVKETKKKKRLSTSWKAVIAVLLALALIAGSSMLFSSGEEEAEPPRPDFTLPESEEELPDSFQEFFENFYVKENRKGEIRVQKAEAVPECTLEFSEPGEELTLQELYRQCADSIVSIAGYTDGTAGYYWGSGIVLSKDGLILTNTHLLEDCDSITVTLTDDRSFEGLLVGADAPSGEADALFAALTKAYPRTEVIRIDGGQPVHQYILVGE